MSEGRKVGVGVDEPVRGGVDRERRPEPDGSVEPRPPQPGARPFVAGRHHAQGDLGPVTVERVAQAAPAGVGNGDDRAGTGVGVRHVRAVDPAVPQVDAFGAARRDGHGLCHRT